MQRRIHINDELGSELVVVGASEAEFIPDEIDRIAAFLQAAPGTRLRDVAFTAASEAKGRPAKIAIVATSVPDLAEKLALARRRVKGGGRRSAFSKGVYASTGMCPAPGRTVFLFPGEGSQYPDMLRDLTLHFPACRAAFDAADTAVASCAPDLDGPPRNALPPSKWIFPTAEAADAASRDSLGTPTAIQAVMAADAALLFLFRQLGIAPDAAMGVGVGEIVALECAGAIGLPEKRNRIRMLGEGFRLISEIAANDKLVPRCVTLSASGVQRDALDALLAPFGGKAAIAGDQTPELFTVSVAEAVVGEVEAALAAGGVSARRLPSVTKPFHTPLMAPYRGQLEAFYRGIVNGEPAIPVYSCNTCEAMGPSREGIVATAAEQWLAPLHVSETIERLYADGYRVFVELGARGVLTTCVAATLRHKPHLALAANRGHRPDMLQLHHTLAALVSHGAALDATQLHAGRDSRALDFAHPGGAKPDKRARRVALPRTLPAFADVAPPPGLVAPAPAPAPESAPGGADDAGRVDFPCLNLAEIVRFSPEESIELSLRLSAADFPYLLDRALSGGPVSAYSKTTRGLLLAPVDLLLEIMAEAARKLHPGKVVAAVEKLEAQSFRALSGDLFAIRVRARRAPRQAPGRQAVEVAVYDQASLPDEAAGLLASCTAFLADAYPAAPAPAPLALKGPIRVDWKAEDLYPVRLYSGERCRAIRSIPELGENGLRAACFVPPRGDIVRSSGSPRFSVSPVVLATLSDALSALHSREPASGILQIPSGCGRIEFFAPQQAEWAPFDANLFAAPAKADEKTVGASAEVVDADHRLLVRATGLRNRVVRIPPAFHRQLLNPLGDFFSTEVPKASLPSLPHEVFCCQVGKVGPDDGDEEIRMRIAASLTLSPSELDKWNDLSLSGIRRHEWLYGRIAAKDAVRKCLLARYGRKLGAADVRIESDEAGKPSPQGLWRKTCGAQMDISITHTPGRIVAAAAPNASLGIDIENRRRAISEEFASSAFSQLEQEIAAESGDGATALFRIWCAKEALSKALGTGLRYGPGDLCARSFDQASGKVEMEATKLWLNPFPHLRGMRIDVQTCLLDDVILAVCVLNPGLAKSETGPFIRWN